ncbi:MAG TPA: S1C family serine protease [Fluviicola sp.]|nr:S1C family serine protease [Fluviicola sp.]
MKINLRIFSLGLLILPVLLVGSCATILNSKYQHIRVKTGHSSARVFVDDSIVGTGELARIKVRRDFNSHLLRVESDSLETFYHTLTPIKKSGKYFFSIIPFFVSIYAPFCDNGIKAYNYPKEISSKQVVKSYAKPKNKKLELVSLDLSGYLGSESIKYKKFVADSFYVNKAVNTTMNFDVAWYNDFLNSRGFGSVGLFEQTEKIFVRGTILEMNELNVVRPFTNMGHSSFFSANGIVKWVFSDKYNNVLYQLIDTSYSDLLPGNSVAFHSTPIDLSTNFQSLKRIHSTTELPNSVIKNSFLKLLSNSTVDSLLYVDTLQLTLKDSQLVSEQEGEVEQLVLNQQAVVTNLKEVVMACVTIKNSSGIFSGFYCGNNGEIMTSYDAIQNFDSVEVIVNSGAVLKGVPLRIDRSNNLAIIKTSPIENLKVIGHSDVVPDYGDDIYVIGTTKMIELSQSIKKGVVSAIRVVEDRSFIQIDASVTNEMVGSPIISSEYKLLGMLGVKINGQGIEGLSFGMSTNTIYKLLNLSFNE